MPEKPGPKPKPEVEIDEAMLPRRIQRNPWARNGKRDEWEPQAFHWAVYEAVLRGGSYRGVAAKFCEAGSPITFQGVGYICKRVDEYLAQYYMDNVRELRARHTGHLEHIFCEAMEAWEKSKGIAVTEEFESVKIEGEDDEPVDAIKTKRKEVHQVGLPAFLNEARSALSDIRKIHAADKNPKMVDADEGADDERVAGKSREAVIDEHIQRLQATKKALQVMGGTTAGAAQSGTEQAG